MTVRELCLTLPNRPGALAAVAGVLAKQRINVAAIAVDSMATRGRVRLVVSDPDRAEGLLTSAGYDVEVREMIALRLEDRAGSFLKVLDVLAQERINVISVAILHARQNGQVLVALSTNDLARARQVLQRARIVSRSAEGDLHNSDLAAGAPSIPTETVGLLM